MKDPSEGQVGNYLMIGTPPTRLGPFQGNTVGWNWDVTGIKEKHHIHTSENTQVPQNDLAMVNV